MNDNNYDESYVAQIAATDIKRFNLSAQTFRETLQNQYKRFHITDDIAYYLRVEGSFNSFVLEPGQQAPDIPLADQMVVGTKGHQCPHCYDNGEVLLNAVGTKTGLRIRMRYPCRCNVYRSYYRYWNDRALVPDNYRKIKLSTIEQFNDDRFANWTGRKHDDLGNPTGVEWPHAAVEELFNTLRTYPDSNYLFCGRAGTGKSTCLIALYQNALWEAANAGVLGPEHIWKVNANQLSEEFHTWKTNRSQSDRPESGQIVEQPTVTPGKIEAAHAAGLKPRLFLEEIDKFNLSSDFQRNAFWSIFEAIEPNNGQIVTTSNLNRKDLEARLGAQHGPAILRRIEGLPNGIYIDFSSAEIIKSFDLPVAGEKAAVASEVTSPAPHPPAEIGSETVQPKKTKLKVDKTGRRIS